MQSNGSRFYGDVVSDSFHEVSPDEDNILEQIYRSKYVRIVFIKILYFTAHNNKEFIKSGFSATVVIVCIFKIRYKELKST